MNKRSAQPSLNLAWGNAPGIVAAPHPRLKACLNGLSARDSL